MTQAVSKRVTNARSAAHYKRNGPTSKRKTAQEDDFWSSFRAKVGAELRPPIGASARSPSQRPDSLTHSRFSCFALVRSFVKISTHPLVFALVAFMMLFSGIATFWMNDRHNRSMFG